MSNTERLAEFGDNELWVELHSRGWRGELKHIDDIETERKLQNAWFDERNWLRKIMPKFIHYSPARRVNALIERVSKNRFLLNDEANKIIGKACGKFSGNSGVTWNATMLGPEVRAIWRGQEIRYPHDYEVAEAMQEAENERRPHTTMKEYKWRKRLGLTTKLQRSERCAKENRKLLSAIKQEIANGEQHQDSRAVA